MNTIQEAIEALKRGQIIIVVDDEDRENEGDFVVLGQYATPENINFMAKHGRGLICTPITAHIAKRLELEAMVKHNSDLHQTAFTVSIDYKTTTTGISAFERADTITALLDDKAKPTDFHRPGHIFPLVAKPGGILERRGHTEAGIELAKLCESPQVAVICEIMSEDGSMARLPELKHIASQYGLKIISIDQIVNYVKQTIH